MKYRIFNKKRNTYLDKNLYFLGQDGIVYRKSSPFPTRYSNQEDLEIRLIIEGPKETKKEDEEYDK
jgi:hypothetical protein